MAAGSLALLAMTGDDLPQRRVDFICDSAAKALAGIHAFDLSRRAPNAPIKSPNTGKDVAMGDASSTETG